MTYKILPYTFQRNGNHYLQIRLSNGRMYKKTLLTECKDLLQKSPTDGVVTTPSKARFGAYSTAEKKKFVGALKQPDNWIK